MIELLLNDFSIDERVISGLDYRGKMSKFALESHVKPTNTIVAYFSAYLLRFSLASLGKFTLKSVPIYDIQF